MTITLSSDLILSIIALIAGILIFIRPQLLSMVVAIFLVVTGAIGIAQEFGLLQLFN